MPASASCSRSIRSPSSHRATSSPAPFTARSPPGAAPSSTAARRSARNSPRDSRPSTAIAARPASIRRSSRSRSRPPSITTWAACSPMPMGAPPSTACGPAARPPPPAPTAPIASPRTRFSKRSSSPPASPTTSRRTCRRRRSWCRWNWPTAASAPRADPADVAALRRTMAADVGVVRDRAGLTRALATIATLEARTRSPRFLDMLIAAKLIAAAALARTESRGGHYRSDFPEPIPPGATAPSSLSPKPRGSRRNRRPVHRGSPPSAASTSA